jgi:hypothetical protein
MFQYRKVLERRSDGFSLRSIRAATGHSRQKITEFIAYSPASHILLKLEF